MNPTTTFVLFGVQNGGVFVPVNFVAGDTTKFNTNFDAYTPEAGWTCTFYLKGSGSLQVSGVPASGSWNFTLPALQTQNLPAGLYTYAYVMNQNGEQYTAQSGRIYVTPNVSTANAGDLITHNQRMLTAINSTLENRANDDAQTMTLYGKAIAYIPIEMLLRLKTQYEYLVYKERNTSQVFGKSISTNRLPWF